jgi:hypothetical protein
MHSFFCVKLGGRGGYRKGKKGQNRGLGWVGADRGQSALNSCEKPKNVVDSYWKIAYNKRRKRKGAQDAQEVTKNV